MNKPLNACVKPTLLAGWLAISLLLLTGNAFAFSGGTGTADDPYQISTRQHLESVNNDLTAHYVLLNDISLSGVSYTNAVIGTSTSGFSGSFDGNGHVISNLSISAQNNSQSHYYVGLFSQIATTGEVRHLGVSNASISAYYVAGAMTGYNYGTITRSYTTGSVVVNTVTGSSVSSAGGFAGWNSGTIEDSYSQASARANLIAGGFTAGNQGTLNRVYSIGVPNAISIGGLEGGLVGYNGSTITAGFWDTQTSGIADQADSRGTGHTTSDMQTAFTYQNAGWDFNTIWFIISGNYPGLQTPTRIIELTGNMAFGNVGVGSTATSTLTITNAGANDLTVTNITLPTGFTSDWDENEFALGANESVDLTITFAPELFQAYTGNIVVTADETSGTDTIAISGTGVEERVIRLEGDLTFGSVYVDDIATATLTVYNDGNTTLNVSNVVYPTGFTGWSGGDVLAGGSRDITVTFSPTAVQTYGGSIAFMSNADSGDNTTTCSGTGIAKSRVIRIEGDLDFGEVAKGETATSTLTIHNDGTSDLTVSGITYPANFSGSWSGTIAGGASQDVTVTFYPDVDGTGVDTAYAGNIQVLADETGGTDTVAVTGTGKEPERVISLDGVMDFGAVMLGDTATRILTIRNTGNAPLTILGIQFPEGYTGDWSSGTVEAGATQDISLTFTPVETKTYNGTITVNANETGGSDSIGVTGEGGDETRIIRLEGTLSFGDVTVGETATATMTVYNDGNSALTITDIAPPADFNVNWDSGIILAGGSQAVTVRFAPKSNDSYSGIVTVTSDSTGGVNTLSCSGNGVLLNRVISLTGDLDFGEVPINDSQDAVLTIHNDGSEELTVNNIVFSDGFSYGGGTGLAGGTSGTIAANGSAQINVTFSPVETRIYTGTVEVLSDKTAGTETIDCSGAGVSSRHIRIKGDMSFGDVVVGDTLTKSLVIYNDGNQPLTVDSITYPDAAYTGDWPAAPPATIAAYGNQVVNVTFTPVADQDYNGNITVNSDSLSGDETIAVTGTGLIELQVAPLLRNVLSGAGSTSFAVENSGTGGTMNWNAVSNAAWVTVTGGSPGVGPGTITVDYSANATTAERSGTITINADLDGDTVYESSVDVTITQSGTGDTLGLAERTINGSAVTIDMQPAADIVSYAVYETLPADTTPTSITPASGVWDAANQQLSWIFFDGEPRELSYVATSTTQVDDTVSGNATYVHLTDGPSAEIPITGDNLLTYDDPHPADTNGDFVMSLFEVMNYIYAYQRGNSWTVAPSPPTLAYVMQAIYLYQLGPDYYNDGITAEPGCWVPAQ
jgi:hypothetical protein